ncbi:MAG: leucyl/phenylalanyl-tRNA--protein transferase [Bacillota bacterium]
MWYGDRIEADPVSILWHYATGYLPDFVNKRDGPVRWVRWSHRGVQYLDRIRITHSQRPYVFSKSFELRFDQAFEAVVGHCADVTRPAIQKRSGQTWITPELAQGLLELHRMGYAHSFEAWAEGQLAGGIWGVQVGGLITMSSMFSRVRNAGRFAMGRAMLHLRDRGFRMVDMGMVPDHHVHFGAEWIPQWKYEAMLPELLRESLTIGEGYEPRPIPWQVRVGVPMVRVARGLRRRLGGRGQGTGVGTREWQTGSGQ